MDNGANTVNCELRKELPKLHSAQEWAFQDFKLELSQVIELALYNPTFDTLTQINACRDEIGTALLQMQPEGIVCVVAMASTSITDTEKRHATIEQKGHGVTWTCEKLNDYIVGLTIKIQTDHKPLIPLLGNIELSKLIARIQWFRIR